MADTQKKTDEKPVDNSVSGENQATGAQSTEKHDDFLKASTEPVEKTPDPAEMYKGMKKLQSNYDKLVEELKKKDNDLKAEREKTLTAKQIEELKQQELLQTLNAKELELKENTLKFDKTKLLHEKGWDIDFLGIVSGNDLESFTENCKTLQIKIDKFIEKKVNERLAKSNTVPTNSSSTNEDVFTAEEINRHRGDQAWFTANLDKIQKSIASRK